MNLVIVIAGVQAIRTLNVRQYPRSENAAITVTTVYVGASAELVRGFITTPLERVIAAADGIDYIESESKQGVSTIRARLRLNYDADQGAGRDQLQGRPGAQRPAARGRGPDHQHRVRRQPVRLRLPELLLASSSSRTRSPITSCAWSSRGSRPSRACSAPTSSGARTFAMRIWLKPDRMAALNVSPAQVRQALAANNYLAAVGQTKGSLVQVNLTANTDLRSVEEFKQLVVRAERTGPWCGCATSPTWCSARRTTTPQVNFSGADGGVHRHLGAAQRQLARRHQARARARSTRCRRSCPSRSRPRIAYDAHRVHPAAPSTRWSQHAARDAAHRRDRHLPLPRLAALGRWCRWWPSRCRSSARVFLMQVFGFTINLLTLLAIVLSVGLVVDDAIVVVENVERHLREGLTPRRGGAAGRARAGRARSSR